MTGSMSARVGGDVRSGYDPRLVDGDMAVADNELASQGCPPSPVPGFVVGHHPGHVTVDVRRCLREDLTLVEARQLGAYLFAHADLAEPGVEAA